MIRSKLLLVDDEEDFVLALAERLRLRDYDVRVATNGEAALSEIQKERPDIVMLDLKMPGMSGLETLKKIKAGDPSIEVVMLTGSISIDGKSGEEGRRAGATEYMVKPIEIESLVEKLKEIRKRTGLD